MTDRLIEALKRLEMHADALMRVPANEQNLAGMQSVISIAILDIKRAIEALVAAETIPGVTREDGSPHA